MRPVFVVILFLATLVVLVSRVNSSKTPIRRKRTSESVITGEHLRIWDSIQRLINTKHLVNKTHSTIRKDCKICFDPETKEDCICDASDIIQHMIDEKLQPGKKRHKLIEKLPEELARTVKKILRREIVKDNQKKQNRKKKSRWTKRKVYRVLALLQKRIREKRERIKNKRTFNIAH